MKKNVLLFSVIFIILISFFCTGFKIGKRNPINKTKTPSLQVSPSPAPGTKGNFNHWTDSSIADENGESRILVRTSCYAGDRFQFGIGFKQYEAGFKDENKMSIRFRNSVLKTKPVVIWKRIFIEHPKILKNVKFSPVTWKYVTDNLEMLNVECLGTFEPLIIDPADPRIFYYFYTKPDDQIRGKGNDPRYGPAGYGPIEVMLSRLNIIFTDQNQNTINVLVFGAISNKKDLIKNLSPLPLTPRPVHYNYQYRGDEIDLLEWLPYGTGLSMAGRSPAIFIWSDFWWLASKAIGVSHEKSLARVILHELGHHLLRFRSERKERILDSAGHLLSSLATRKSIMTGSGIIRLNKPGKPFVSANAIRLERCFIKNPS